MLSLFSRLSKSGVFTETTLNSEYVINFTEMNKNNNNNNNLNYIISYEMN